MDQDQRSHQPNLTDQAEASPGIQISTIGPLKKRSLLPTDFNLETGRILFPAELWRSLERSAANRPYQRFLKRLFDVGFALCALLLLAPVVALIILFIKLDSPGPIYFSQIRVGRAGRLFRLYKFRTMVSNAEDLKASLLLQNECDGPAFKMRNDPRVTRVGRFLRKTSLDELPQLWNVLIGDMALVGPRPALPLELLDWEEWQIQRLSVEQGCTCIWQVNGRSDISFTEWMEMDVDYVRNWSLWLDLQLILRTIWVMVRGRGAY